MIDRLQERINILARFVHAYSTTLNLPTMDHRQHAYRYTNPGYRHFMLLRACRIISALNASAILARQGYPQEIGILCRMVQESKNQIQAVLAQLNVDGAVSGRLDEFIKSYFADDQRVLNQKPKAQTKLSQKYINELIGAELDPYNPVDPTDPDWKSTAERHHYLDWIHSNYVHGRYPETMDLFGGHQGHFHLHGMKGTPKDAENLAILEQMIASTSLCFVHMCQSLELDRYFAYDPTLAEWRRRMGSFS